MSINKYSIMSSVKRRHDTGSTSGNPANIALEQVRCFWLSTDSSHDDKYLLIEDKETGDILIPLIYMKSILEANYSRKLAALKNREVKVPQDSSLHERQGLLFWHWAFECPQPIKRLVRDHLGETKPQGHLRLVLLPIVYNAMASKEELHGHPLFKPLHRAMKRSSYWPLLTRSLVENLSEDEDKDDSSEKLFDGPKVVEKTALKYMFMFESVEDMEFTKRLRTTNVAGDSRFNSSGIGTDLENLDTIRASNPLQDKDRNGDPTGVSAAKDLFQMLMSQDGPQIKYPQYGQLDMEMNRFRNTFEARFQELMNEISSVKAGVMAIMQCLATILSTSSEQRSHMQAPLQHPQQASRNHESYDFAKMSGQGTEQDIGVEQIIQLLSRFQNGNGQKDIS